MSTPYKVSRTYLVYEGTLSSLLNGSKNAKTDVGELESTIDDDGKDVPITTRFE